MVNLVRVASASSEAVGSESRPSSATALPSTPADVVRFVALGWLVSMVAIGVWQLALGGLHERIDLPPLTHWLRDSALAVPLAAIALAVAGLLMEASAPEGGGLPTGPAATGLVGSANLRARATWAVAGAIIFAGLAVPAGQAHGLVFGGDQEADGLLADALRDGGLAFAGAMAVLLPAALIRLAPWPARQASFPATVAVASELEDPRLDLDRGSRSEPPRPADEPLDVADLSTTPVRSRGDR